MLSRLHGDTGDRLDPVLERNTAIQTELTDSSWKETREDVVTTGSHQWMSHQERYEFVKNRTYSLVRHSRDERNFI